MVWVWRLALGVSVVAVAFLPGRTWWLAELGLLGILLLAPLGFLPWDGWWRRRRR